MARASRVLILVTQSDWGGVQSFLLDFARALRDEGREVLIACGGEGELIERAQAENISIRRLSWMHRQIRPWRDWRALFELRSVIKEFQPDAIHLNSSKMGVLGSLASIGLRTRVVYRIGGWSFLEPMSRLAQDVYRQAERWTSRWKDRVLVVHPGDAEVARMIGIPSEKIVCAPNGLDVTTFQLALHPRSMARTLLGLPMNALVFGTVANAYPAKALDRYLKVADRVLRQDQHAHVCIIGDGPEFERCQKLRSILPEKDRIHLVGRRADAKQLYPAFDVFVLPSVKEGMPWSVLEAMASSVPVIATDVGACRWMIEGDGFPACGLIVPPSDPLALETAMHELRTQPERAVRLGEMGAQQSQSRFSWDVTYRLNRDALDT